MKNKFNFKACFSLKNACDTGFEVDKGGLLKKNGKYTYGWNEDRK